jgi:hypothetical protein
MKSLMRSFSVIFLFILPGMMFAQMASVNVDEVYGLDPILYNGKKYTYFLPSGTGGNQYLFSPDYYIGSVTIKGQTFDLITLNYDIYNQQLLLQYATEAGSLSIIEVSKAWLESFWLGVKKFNYIDLGDGPRFYQVLGEGQLQVLYYWSKDLKLDVTYGAHSFTFTPAMKDSWLLIDGKLLPFKNKHTFLSAFNPAQRPLINDYIRRSKVRIKKASDQAMTQLINYIGSLE